MSITAGVFQSVMFYFSHFFEEAKKNRERKGQKRIGTQIFWNHPGNVRLYCLVTIFDITH